jgi:hypothetical protein
MKLRNTFLVPVLWGLLVSFTFFSCKTQPEEVVPDSLTDSSTYTGAADQAAEDLNGLPDTVAMQLWGDGKARAEAARAKAQSVDAASYFPSDWNSAEGDFNAAESAGQPATLGQARDQAQEWGRLEAAYNDLYQRSIPRFADDKKQQVLAARQAAIDAGADDILPVPFGAADSAGLAAQSSYDNGDYDAALASGTEAYDRYNVLTTIAQAYGVQQEINSHDFFSYDPADYEAAADAGNSAVTLYNSGNLAQAQAKADESLAKFKAALNKSWASYGEAKSVSARTMRQAALDEKANVAVKSDFQNADAVYNQGFVALRAAQYENAANLFTRAEDQFRRSRDLAVDKRIKAEEAIRAAEEKVAESDDLARAIDEAMSEED